MQGKVRKKAKQIKNTIRRIPIRIEMWMGRIFVEEYKIDFWEKKFNIYEIPLKGLGGKNYISAFVKVVYGGIFFKVKFWFYYKYSSQFYFVNDLVVFYTFICLSAHTFWCQHAFIRI